MMDSQDRVRFWIQEALKNEDVTDYKITLKGTTGKSDGYVGDIYFAEVSGADNQRRKKDLHVVIKQGKTNPELRKLFPIRTYFEREMYIYNNVLPLFTRFQEEKNIKNPFNCFPKCFKTMLFEDTEILVLENCKPLGYELLSSKSMNLSHMKLVLKNFAKFHALIYAYRDQNKSQFDELTLNFSSTMRLVMSDVSFRNVFRKGVSKACCFLRERNEGDVADMLEGKLNDSDPCVIMDKIVHIDVEESVIIHGDNWMNNFMFKYEGSDKQTPADLCILDWQLSSLHSPVMDLSYFIYAVSSKEELDKFEDLMQYYYAHLSVFLRDLGSDPEEIMPYSTLLTHWKKYAAFAAIWVVSLLDTMMCDEKDAPSANDFSGGTGMGDIFLNLKISDEEMYKTRLVAIIKHFCLN